MGRIKEISRRPTRSVKRNPVVYLICEGSETEIRYFKRFRSRGCNIDIIPISSQYKSADRLVQKAKAISLVVDGKIGNHALGNKLAPDKTLLSWTNTAPSAPPPEMPARCAGQAGSSTGSLWLPRRSRALPGLHIRAAHGTAA